MELLHIDVAGPFDEGLDGSRYWVTIVDDFTGWIEIIPIPRRQHFVIESLRFFLDHNERPERKCRRIRLDRISEQVGEEMKFMFFSRAIKAEVTGVDQHQQNGVAERAHKTIYDRVGPTQHMRGCRLNSGRKLLEPQLSSPTGRRHRSST